MNIQQNISFCKNMFNWKNKRIYADTASSTAIDKEVLSVLIDNQRQVFGNSESLHTEGLAANKLLNQTRREIKEITKAGKVVFLSGGTEANVLAIQGVVNYFKHQQIIPHIITSSIEHSSVLETTKNIDCEITILPVDSFGFIKEEDLVSSFKPNTVLVSLNYINNEIGVIYPLKKYSRHIKQHRLNNKTSYPYFHTDACQAPRFVNLNFDSLGVDLMTLNSSKIYGPKGVGGLVFNQVVNLKPVLTGGGQEFGLRSGTVNVPAIVAFGLALKKSQNQFKQENEKLVPLRDKLVNLFLDQIEGSYLNGPLLNDRVANNINIGFRGVEAQELMLALDVCGIAVSAGSACSNKKSEGSHVLKAIGADPLGGLRISFDRNCSNQDIDKIFINTKQQIERIRKSKELLN